jgi:hypothetical protein
LSQYNRRDDSRWLNLSTSSLEQQGEIEPRQG